MIVHSYTQKILVKVPNNSSEHKIVEKDQLLFLSYNQKGKHKPIFFDLNTLSAHDIDLQSHVMKISTNKIEIYRNLNKTKKCKS